MNGQAKRPGDQDPFGIKPFGKSNSQAERRFQAPLNMAMLTNDKYFVYLYKNHFSIITLHLKYNPIIYKIYI